MINADSPNFCTKNDNMGLGSISIIFVLRVNSTRYTEHNTKINIECPQ